jgi:hypothetical protein
MVLRSNRAGRGSCARRTGGRRASPPACRRDGPSPWCRWASCEAAHNPPVVQARPRLLDEGRLRSASTKRHSRRCRSCGRRRRRRSSRATLTRTSRTWICAGGARPRCQQEVLPRSKHGRAEVPRRAGTARAPGVPVGGMNTESPTCGSRRGRFRRRVSGCAAIRSPRPRSCRRRWLARCSVDDDAGKWS